MEKPKIVELFETQVKSEVSLIVEKGEKTDYYNYFIDFLEEKKRITLVNGNVVGLVSSKQAVKYNSQSSPFGVEQIEYGIKYLRYMQKMESGNIIVEQGTVRQTTLAFYYMEKLKLFPRHSGEFTVDAKFLNFLTGNNHDRIRKILPDPLKREDTKRSTHALKKDLTIIQNQFKQIHFSEGVNLIQEDIDKINNDLESYKEI